MDFAIPDKPTRPDINSNDPQYAAQMLDYQQQMSLYQMAVQRAQQELSEITSIATNMERSRHEAMMAIIRNMA